MVGIAAIAGGAALAGGLAGLLGGDPTTTSRQILDPRISEELNRILAQLGLFDREFGGDFVTQARAEETTGLQEQAAVGADPRFQQLASRFGFNLLESAGEIGSLRNLDPEQNRALKAQLGTIDTSSQEFFNQALTQLLGGAQRQGAFGGTRAGVIGAQLAGETARARGAAEADVLGRERGLISLAPGLFRGGTEALLTPGQIQTTAGTGLRGLEDLNTQNILAKFFFPQQQLERRAALVQGFIPGTTSTETQTRTNPFQRFLQGALGGGALGLGIGSAFGLGAPAGGANFASPESSRTDVRRSPFSQQQFFQPQPFRFQNFQGFTPGTA